VLLVKFLFLSGVRCKEKGVEGVGVVAVRFNLRAYMKELINKN
jgi:hypothetical protein